MQFMPSLKDERYLVVCSGEMNWEKDYTSLLQDVVCYGFILTPEFLEYQYNAQ